MLIPIPRRERIDLASASTAALLLDQTVEFKRIGVHAHVYYIDLFAELADYLNHCYFPFDLFITTDTADKARVLKQAAPLYVARAASVQVVVRENRGRDIYPFLSLSKTLREYDLCLHVHTKRSPSAPFGDQWRWHNLDSLLGSPPIIAAHLRLLADPRLAYTQPANFPLIRDKLDWSGNREPMRAFAERIGLDEAFLDEELLEFPAGSMIWFKPVGLRPLFDKEISAEDFPVEKGQTNQTLAHAVERLFPYLARHNGLDYAEVALDEPEHEPPTNPGRLGWQAREIDRLRELYDEQQRRMQQVLKDHATQLDGLTTSNRRLTDRVTEQQSALQAREAQIGELLRRQHNTEQALQAVLDSPTWRRVQSLRRAANWYATGREQGLSTLRRLRYEYVLLHDSALFDPSYYFQNNPGLAVAGCDPLLHYLSSPADEVEDPNPLFDNRWYLEHNPDVAAAGFNPLVHYLLHGVTDGRDPNPFFDTDWYLQRYPDVAAAGFNPLAHFLLHGASEGRNPGPEFSIRRYLEQHPELAGTGINPLAHYLRYEYRQHANVSPLLDGRLPPRWWFGFEPSRAENNALDVAATLARMARNPVPPVIVVPVYDAVEALEACLRSLLSHSGRHRRIIVIDDASPDPRVTELLARHADSGRIEHYRNSENLGFTATVNRGIELAGRADVVLLNSDTEVPPGWLRNLRLAAYSEDRVGTATPLSNNAGAFSVPEIGRDNPIPPWLSVAHYGRAITQAALRSHPRVPTGNGFCLYLRRDCLDETGLFDVQAFPRGYGEENDFCMRAGRLGWTHVIDDATLVYHQRSASFGSAKTELMQRGRAVVDARYPEYKTAIACFDSDPGLRAVRERIREIPQAMTTDLPDVKPRILFVISTRTGGTPQTNQDLMHALGDRIEAFVLRCDAHTMEWLYFDDCRYVELDNHRLATPIKAFPHRSEEYDAVVAAWLVHYAVELVHIRHIAWHGLGLIDMAKALDLPIVFSFHDFYTVCPTVNLLDNENVFCAGRCTASVGQCQHQLWKEPDFPPLKHAAIHDWQNAFAALLEQCDQFVTTCDSARQLLLENYPQLSERPFHVIPHGRDFDRFGQFAASVRAQGIIRMLIPGNITESKGARLIEALGEVAERERLELHILGTVTGRLQETPGVILHGPYLRSEFMDKVQAIEPHIGGVFSIWPETYCHTLTELWACGIPVIGFDLGAVGERIRASGAGWLAATTAEGVLRVVTALRDHPDEHARKIEATLRWQKDEARIHDCLYMSHAYFDIYRVPLLGQGTRNEHATGWRRPVVAVITPNTRIENGRVIAAPGSTHVRLVEKAQDDLEREVRYEFVPPGMDPYWITKRFSAVLVQRNALSADQATALITATSDKNCPLIVELDDDLRALSESKNADTEYHGYQETLDYLLSSASCVMVSTDILRQRFLGITKNCIVIPNMLSARLWMKPIGSSIHEITSSDLFEKRTSREVRVVYMGSSTHNEDLNLLKEAIIKIRKHFPSLKLFIIGVTKEKQNWYEEIPIKNKNYPDFVPWLRHVFSTMDFGIAPLQDKYFNNAKSDLKFLEYTAAKLPGIYSNVVAYKNIVRDGENGLLSENNIHSWLEKINYAYNNHLMMEKMVEKAFDEVLKNRLLCHHIKNFDSVMLGFIRKNS